MSLSEEWLLALLLIGLYLHDGLVFTGPDTAWLARGPKGRWTACFPTRSFTLGGRHVFLAPQWPPGTPLFRLDWHAEAKARAAESAWNAQSEADRLSSLRWSSAFCFVAVLVLVPLALVANLPTALVLAAIAGAYVSTIAAVVVLWRWRHRLGLDRAQCAKLTAEMLLCPPVAANLVRRVCAHRPPAEDFVSAARRLLKPGDWDLARVELERRIDDQLEIVDPGTPRHAALNHLRAQLA